MKTLGTLALLVSAVLHGETIDRIAVSVGNRVITTSDIERQIRVSAFQSGVKPDLSSVSRKTMADRLVEYTLIRRDIENAHYPVHEASEIEPALAEFKKKYYPAEQAYRAALSEYGITEDDLKEFLLHERTFNAFIEVRFRPAVQVTDEEIQAYFTKNFPAGASFDENRDKIEQILIGERVDQELNRWLAEARKRNEVVYHAEALQ